MSFWWFLLLGWIVLMPITYAYPLYLLEKSYFHNRVDVVEEAELIVILGAGLTESTTFQRPNLTDILLERVRFGAFLQRKKGKKILLTGGGFHSQYSEAEIMKHVLEEEFHASVSFCEEKSKTTEENAKFSSDILKKNNIESIYLVSNSWHLKRAVYLFEKHMTKIKIIPMANFFYSNKKFQTGWRDFIPNFSTFHYQRRIYFEYLALWYQKI